MKEPEERLYVGITPNGYIFRHEDEILANTKAHGIEPIYYAMLPKGGSPDWHTTYTEWTFKQSGTRLVVYQQPLQLEGLSVAEVAEENSVETRYQYMLAEAKMALRNGDPLLGYKLNVDQPLTYVFVYELPKFVVTCKKGEYVLEQAKSLSDIIYRIKENFCSPADFDN
jgi:hypothetical protein